MLRKIQPRKHVLLNIMKIMQITSLPPGKMSYLEALQLRATSALKGLDNEVRTDHAKSRIDYLPEVCKYKS